MFRSLSWLAAVLLFVPVSCDRSERATPTPRAAATPAAPSKPAYVPIDATTAMSSLPTTTDTCAAQQCLALALQHHKGDWTEAIPLLRRACELDEPTACSLLSSSFREGKGGLATNPAAEVALGTRACDLGDAIGCNDVGLTLLNGDGVPADVDKGLAALDKACASTAYRACGTLARYWANKDKPKAITLGKQGCDHGDTYACDALKEVQGGT